MNSFGEPLDEAQTIVALEQVDGHSTVVHEVLRVDAGEFDADAVNGLLVGHFAYPWIKIIAGVAIVVVLLVVLRFLLGIFVQVKYLLPDAPRSAMMDGANISGANATATPESNQS